MVPCKTTSPGAPGIPMLPIKSYVDPRRDFATAKGVKDLSKPARRKQWLGGYGIPGAFLDGLFSRLATAPDRSSLCVSRIYR